MIATSSSLHDRFLELLPHIELHGRIFFRHVKCRQKKADAIAEMVALAWKWFVRLVERGKDAGEFVTTFAKYAGFAVLSGRRLCGHEKAKDVLSPAAQQRHSFTVQSMPSYSTLSSNPMMDALIDNMVSPVPDQVAFRLDFPTWHGSHHDRDRRMIQDMAMGERTQDLAQRYGCSSGRISQKREEFHDDWNRYCAEPAVG